MKTPPPDFLHDRQWQSTFCAGSALIRTRTLPQRQDPFRTTTLLELMSLISLYVWFLLFFMCSLAKKNFWVEEIVYGDLNYCLLFRVSGPRERYVGDKPRRHEKKPQNRWSLEGNFNAEMKR